MQFFVSSRIVILLAGLNFAKALSDSARIFFVVAFVVISISCKKFFVRDVGRLHGSSGKFRVIAEL